MLSAYDLEWLIKDRLRQDREFAARQALIRQAMADRPSLRLRLGLFLVFMTRERLADALQRMQNAALSPDRRRDHAKKFLNAAWRYYGLADLAVTERDPKTAAALRIGFEDAYTYLGSMMVDPMWAGAGSRPAAAPDDRKAVAVLAAMLEASRTFIRGGTEKRFPAAR